MAALNSDAIERISNNSSEATLPPSYRQRNRAANAHHRYSGSHLLPGGRLMYSHSSSSHNNYTLGMSSPTPSSRAQQPPPPPPPLVRSSSFEHLATTEPSSLSGVLAPVSLPPRVTARQRNVNNVNITTPSANKQTKNSKKDLVTIVTISGCVDEASAPIVDSKNEEGELLAHL